MANKSELTLLLVNFIQEEQKLNVVEDLNFRKASSNAFSILADISQGHSGKLIQTSETKLLVSFPNPKKAAQAAYDSQCTISKDISIEPYLKLAIVMDHSEGELNTAGATGEVMNVISRMILHCKGGEILLTKAVYQTLPASFSMNTRGHGKMKLPGKLLKKDIYQLIWEEDSAEQTIISDNIKASSPAAVRLIIQHQGRKYQLGEERPSFLIGRGDQNDLVIKQTVASRHHAKIKLVEGRFVFTDQSTNGSYLRNENKESFHIHQKEITLQGKGVISIGQTISKQNPDLIYYVVSKN